MNRIVLTGDGSHTIYVPDLDEHYHSVHGAIQESEIVYIRNGFERIRADHVRIFETGFGTGLNAFLTLLKSEKHGKKVSFTSVEKHPVDKELAARLNYPQLTDISKQEIFNLMHSSEWNKAHQITENFQLLKVRSGLEEYDLPDCKFDLIYYDAFGPDKQPDLWKPEILEKICSGTSEGSIFVTYSVKGEVKRVLRSLGFKIELLPGPPGKRQVLRAVKI